MDIYKIKEEIVKIKQETHLQDKKKYKKVIERYKLNQKDIIVMETKKICYYFKKPRTLRIKKK